LKDLVNPLIYSCSFSTNILYLTGDEENIEKFNRRLVKVSKQHNEECKELLKLMGVPFIEV
jgi:5'-3' exonuclease